MNEVETLSQIECESEHLKAAESVQGTAGLGTKHTKLIPDHRTLYIYLIQTQECASGDAMPRVEVNAC